MKKGFLLPVYLFFVLAFPTHINAQVITTIAGNGVAGYSGDNSAAIAAKLNAPAAVALDTFGNLFIADAGNHCIRKVDASGIITTIAGNGTPGFSGDGSAATSAQLNRPYGVAVDNYGNVYISDYDNNRIRKVNTAGVITTIAGNGISDCTGNGMPATNSSVGGPGQIIVDESGNLYWVESNVHVVRKRDPTGIISIFAGMCGSVGSSPTYGAYANATGLDVPRGVAKDKYGNVYISDLYYFLVYKVDASGIIHRFAGMAAAGGTFADGDSATHYFFPNPSNLAVDTTGNLYISNVGALCKIRRVDAASGLCYTVAGNNNCGYNGEGMIPTAAQVQACGIAVAKNGTIYIAEAASNRVRKIGSGTSTTSMQPIEPTDSDLRVYPNPSGGYFTINIPSLNAEKAHVVIVNLLGEKIQEHTISTNTSHDITLKVSPGIYFLSAITGDRKWYKKIIVNN